MYFEYNLHIMLYLNLLILLITKFRRFDKKINTSQKRLVNFKLLNSSKSIYNFTVQNYFPLDIIKQFSKFK